MGVVSWNGDSAPVRVHWVVWRWGMVFVASVQFLRCVERIEAVLLRHNVVFSFNLSPTCSCDRYVTCGTAYVSVLSWQSMTGPFGVCRLGFGYYYYCTHTSYTHTHTHLCTEVPPPRSHLSGFWLRQSETGSVWNISHWPLVWSRVGWRGKHVKVTHFFYSLLVNMVCRYSLRRNDDASKNNFPVRPRTSFIVIKQLWRAQSRRVVKDIRSLGLSLCQPSPINFYEPSLIKLKGNQLICKCDACVRLPVMLVQAESSCYCVENVVRRTCQALEFSVIAY